MDPNSVGDIPQHWLNSALAGANVVNGGFLNDRSQSNPNSGSLTTTPFPRITIFNDHRDRTLNRHINLAMPHLTDIINLYVSKEILAVVIYCYVIVRF